MKKLTEKQVKNRVLQFMSDMEWAFDYQNFDRCVIFKKQPHTKDIACQVICDWEYRRVTVEVFPCFFDASPEIQRGYLLHEFCHTFTDKLCNTAVALLNGKFYTFDQIKDLNEEATSRITQIIEALLKGKMRYARDGFAKYTAEKKVIKKKSKK